MDNEPLWSQDPYGNYWLVFPNKHALHKDEIKEIFSQYSRVKMVTESGDARGLRFVQFPSLDDVKSAVDNLKDHPQINFVPYRPKDKKNQNSNVTKEGSTGNDPEKRNFFQRQSANNQNWRTSNEEKSSSDSNMTDFQNLEFESDYDKASTCSSNTSNNRKNIDDSSFINNNYNDKSRVRHTCTPTQSLTSSGHSEQVKMLLQTPRITSNTFNTKSTTNSDVDCDYEDELPDLVAGNKFKQASPPKKVIYNADEVIVANIPNDHGSAYLLHLFEKFEPIAISYVKTAPKNEIRYCHVYFKSVEDSMGVETKFDKHILSGNQLVVLRPCNLQEEVANYKLPN